MALTEIQKEWVAALRTDIPQTTGYLGRTDGSRCCLGVACDIAVKHGIISKPVTAAPRDSEVKEKRTPLTYDQAICVLPETVRVFIGLTTVTGEYNTSFQARRALYMNNDDRVSFKEIADFIESEPEGLFVQV